MAPRDFAIESEAASGARMDPSATILLDIGDQALRWRYGNRFATSVGGSSLVEGIYLPWTAFNLSFLPLFHRRSQLIIVAALDFGANEGEIRVRRGRWIRALIARVREPTALHQKLLELLAVLGRHGRLPKRRALVAIQASAAERPPDGCSPWMAADRLGIEVERLVREWRSNRKEDGDVAMAAKNDPPPARSRCASMAET
jgi:hypothetical protein